MTQLNCCICMLPLTANATLEIPDFDAEDFYDFDENDQGFEDYVDERSRNGVGRLHTSRTTQAANNIFFDAISPSGAISASDQNERSLPVQPVGIKATSCGHLYHADCLRLWLNTLELEGRPKVCAYCRKPLKRRSSVITIYPVSLTETEEDHQGVGEVSSTSNCLSNSGGCLRDGPATAQEIQKSVSCLRYYDKLFIYTLLNCAIHLAAFMNYIQSCSVNLEEERIEEDDFIPFGAGWAIMTTIVCIISCGLDCCPLLWSMLPS